MSLNALPVSGSINILAVPFPVTSHLNSMLNLCKLLVTSNPETVITVVLSEERVRMTTEDGTLLNYPNIRLMSIPDVAPTKGQTLEEAIKLFMAVLFDMETPFVDLLDKLKVQVTCIVTDMLLSTWMISIGRKRNIPVVSMWPMSPSYLYELNEELESLPRTIKDENIDDTSFENALHSMVFHGLRAQAVIIATFYELEPHVIDILRAKFSIPFYTIGPTIPFQSLEVLSPNPIPRSYVETMSWLDSQLEGSVLYISFGSVLSRSNEEIDELLEGVQSTGIKFLMVARNESARLQEKYSENGLIVPWCDQLRVLLHSSVGGFLTHCGWNSIMESIYAGVPLLTFPFPYGDQPSNCKHIVEDIRIGLTLQADEVVKERVIGREDIGNAVRRLMDMNGDDGKRLRRRTHELQKLCREATEFRGSMPRNISDLINHFFCKKP